MSNLQVAITSLQAEKSGTTLTIVDSTGSQTVANPNGYGGTNPLITAVQYTRMIFSDYTWTQSPLTAQTAFTGFGMTSGAWASATQNYSNEWIALATLTYDAKNVLSGQTFIPINTGVSTVASGITQTGRNLVNNIRTSSGNPASFLPVNSSVTLSPTDLGYATGTTIFPDTVMSCQYEVYGGTGVTAVATATGTIVVGTQYVVMGANGTYIVTQINGISNIYYAGEVFVADSTSFDAHGGTITVYPIMSSCLLYFPMLYNSVTMMNKALAMAQNAGLPQQAREYANMIVSEYNAINAAFVDSVYSPALPPNYMVIMSQIQQIANLYNAISNVV